MAKNPLAVSTGQGKGEAQVFGSTYNPYFKEQKAEAEGRLKEGKDLADVDYTEAWDRDNAIFASDIQQVQKYVQDNARRIMEGDNTAIMEAKELQNQVLGKVNMSKTAKKRWFELMKRIESAPEGTYTEESIEAVRSFGDKQNMGNFDYSQLKLVPKFNYQEFIEDAGSQVKKMNMVDGKYQIPNPLPGTYNNYDQFVKYSATPKEAVENYAKFLWNQSGSISDQMKKQYGNDINELIKDLDSYRQTETDELIKKESTGGGGSGYGKDSTTLPELIVDEEDIGMETPFNYDGTAYAIGGNTKRYKGFSASGKRGRVVNFDSKDVLYVNPISKDALANPEDTETFLETNQWSKIQEKIQKEGAVSGRIEGVYYYPIFKAGAKGARTGTDLSNQLVPKEILDNNGKLDIGEGKEEKDYSDLIEFKPMIAIKKSGQSGATVLKPYEGNEHLVKDAIEDGSALVADYEEYMKKEKKGNKTYTFDEWFDLSNKEREEVVEEQEETTEEGKASDKTLSLLQ